MYYSQKSQRVCLFHLLLIVTMACIITGCGATGKAYVASTPTSGHALIYIYRLGRVPGSANAWYLSANGTRITTVTNGGYFAYDAKPGNVTFSAKLRPSILNFLFAIFMPEEEMITVNVEPDNVYFVKFDHKFNGPYMEVVDKSIGETDIHYLYMFDRWED